MKETLQTMLKNKGLSKYEICTITSKSLPIVTLFLNEKYDEMTQDMIDLVSYRLAEHLGIEIIEFRKLTNQI